MIDKKGFLKKNWMIIMFFAIVFLFLFNFISPLLVDFVSPTPANGAPTSNTSVEINISIIEQNLNEVKFNWNGTNYTLYDNNLIGMYNFDNLSAIGENDDLAVNVARGGPNGTRTGNVASTNLGKYGGSKYFDGSVDYFTFSNFGGITNNSLSFSFWLNDTSTSGIRRWFTNTNGAFDSSTVMIREVNGEIAIYCGDGGNVASTSGYSSSWKNNWHQYTLIQNSSGCFAYEDGEIFLNTTTTNTVPGSTFYLGGYYFVTNGEYSIGYIDELRVWNRSLSIEEIQQNYMSNLNKFNTTNWYLYVNQSKNATAGLTEGTYTYSSSIKNTSGQENVSTTRTVVVDFFTPSISYGTGTSANNSYVSQSSIYVNVSVTETNENTIIFTLFNSTTLVNETTYTNSTRTINWTGLSDGIYYYNVTVNDTAGKINWTDTRIITLDTIFPLIDFTNPTPVNYFNTSSTNVEINLSIIEKNLNEVKFNWNWTNYTFYDRDLIGMYNFDNISVLGDNSTRVVDLSSSGNNGTIYGAGYNLSGRYGKSMQFDGVNDYISGMPPLDGQNQFTMLAWIKHNAISAQQDIIAYRDAPLSLVAFESASGKLQIQLRDNGGTYLLANADTTMGVGIWYFVGLTVNYGTDEVKLYLNGVSDGTTSYAGSPMAALAYRYIGSDYYNGGFFNGSIDEVRIWNRSLSASEINQYYMLNLNKFNSTQWYFYSNQSKNVTNGLADGTYNYTVYVNDLAGNLNQTATRTVTIESIPPTMSNIVYNPNSSAGLDPLAQVMFNVTVTDLLGVSAVIFQYYNGTGWRNQTASALTGNIYQANLTLDSINTNYTFNFWVNDTSGNFNHSINQTFESTWDCTWVSTGALGSTSGWDQNKEIGNITINNTGDAAFSNNNCSLDFRVTYDLTEGRIFYDGEYIKNLGSYTIAAGQNQTIRINATFLSEIKEENVIITIDEFRTRSSTRYRNVTSTIVSNQNNPYLVQSLSSTSSSVYLTSTNFSLQGYLRNIMGNAIANASLTAYNVSFYWTLPSGLTNVSGNLTMNFTNISDNNLNYNNIEVGFVNLASVTSGTKTFSLFSQGYNSSGDLIPDANGILNLSDSVNISFLCYNVSDGVYVTVCGSTDGDYVAPSTTTTTTAGSGGGGGGGSAAVETIKTSADYQLIRGKENQVKVIFKNKDQNQSLRNLEFSVYGGISKYVDIIPKQKEVLAPGEEIEILLKIISPTYIELGKQELTLRMEGKKGNSNYLEDKKISLEIHELSVEEAYDLLNKSRKLIEQLNNENLFTDYLNGLLINSESDLELFNLEGIRNNFEIINTQVNYALNTKSIISELEPLILLSIEKGISVSESSRLLKLAKLSLERREFEQSYKRIKDAQLAYALETKGEFGRLSYYFGEYPGEISLGMFILFLLSFGTYKVDKLRRIKRRIKQLKQEEKTLSDLIKVLQNDTFRDKKMSMAEYVIAIREYNQRLTEVIEELIELETKRVHLFKLSSESKRLKFEKAKVINMIKELQEDYLKKRKVETKTFEIKMESFNRRISEIEERLVTMEAQKAIGGFKLKIKAPKEIK